MDQIAYVERMPTIGETLHGKSYQVGFGGKGANQAVAAAKLGSEVSIISCVGEDPNGHATLDNFDACGVDRTHVQVRTESSTGVAPIAVDESGANVIIVVMGANDLLGPQDVIQARPVIASAKVLLCQLELPKAASLAALKLAREANVLSILNTAPAMKLDDEFFAAADIICPNQPELEMLTNMPTATDEQAVAAARELLHRGARRVVLTLGSRGVMLIDRDTVEHVRATEHVAVDTVGAGDAFMGAFAHFIAQDTRAELSAATVLDAIKRANVVSGVSVTRKGTQTSFPTKSELLETEPRIFA